MAHHLSPIRMQAADMEAANWLSCQDAAPWEGQQQVSPCSQPQLRCFLPGGFSGRDLIPSGKKFAWLALGQQLPPFRLPLAGPSLAPRIEPKVLVSLQARLWVMGASIRKEFS